MQILIIASQSVSFMSSRMRSLAIQSSLHSQHTKTNKDEVSMSTRSLWQHSGEHRVDSDILNDSNSIKDSSCPAGTNDRAP
jgi:hypothetical protein